MPLSDTAKASKRRFGIFVIALSGWSATRTWGGNDAREDEMPNTSLLT